jgi:hypothetical protein
MSEQVKDERVERRDRRFLAFILIVLGLLALVPNLITVSTDLALLVLPLIGIVLLAYGLLAWRYGFSVAGCIITGLGTGVFIAEQGLVGNIVTVMTQMTTTASGVESQIIDQQISGNAEAGVILLGLAAGFIGIALVNLLFSKKAFWWPLIPGAILGVVGALLTIDTTVSMNLLEQIGRFWPVILLIIGVWMLLRHDAARRTQ